MHFLLKKKEQKLSLAIGNIVAFQEWKQTQTYTSGLYHKNAHSSSQALTDCINVHAVFGLCSLLTQHNIYKCLGAGNIYSFFRALLSQHCNIHYENTPIQIHWKFYHQKLAIFRITNRRGGSNEYPQSMFLSRNNKNNVYPCKPQFYYIKVGFKGVKII